MRPRQVMDRGAAHHQEEDGENNHHVRAAPEHVAEQDQQGQHDHAAAQHRHPGQAPVLVNQRHQHIREPFPGEPRGAWLGIREEVGRRNGAVPEDPVSGTNVPAGVPVGQQGRPATPHIEELTGYRSQHHVAERGSQSVTQELDQASHGSPGGGLAGEGGRWRAGQLRTRGGRVNVHMSKRPALIPGSHEAKQRCLDGHWLGASSLLQSWSQRADSLPSMPPQVQRQAFRPRQEGARYKKGRTWPPDQRPRSPMALPLCTPSYSMGPGRLLRITTNSGSGS